MKIVYIEWEDAAEAEEYHEDVDKPKGQGPGLQTSYSVGILVKDTKEYIALAQTVATSGWHRNIISIPKVGIVSQKVLME